MFKSSSVCSEDFYIDLLNNKTDKSIIFGTLNSHDVALKFLLSNKYKVAFDTYIDKYKMQISVNEYLNVLIHTCYSDLYSTFLSIIKICPSLWNYVNEWINITIKNNSVKIFGYVVTVLFINSSKCSKLSLNSVLFLLIEHDNLQLFKYLTNKCTIDFKHRCRESFNLMCLNNSYEMVRTVVKKYTICYSMISTILYAICSMPESQVLCLIVNNCTTRCKKEIASFLIKINNYQKLIALTSNREFTLAAIPMHPEIHAVAFNDFNNAKILMTNFKLARKDWKNHDLFKYLCNNGNIDLAIHMYRLNATDVPKLSVMQCSPMSYLENVYTMYN